MRLCGTKHELLNYLGFFNINIIHVYSTIPTKAKDY